MIVINHELTAPDTLLNKTKTPAPLENNVRVAEELRDEKETNLVLKEAHQYPRSCHHSLKTRLFISVMRNYSHQRLFLRLPQGLRKSCSQQTNMRDGQRCLGDWGGRRTG